MTEYQELDEFENPWHKILDGVGLGLAIGTFFCSGPLGLIVAGVALTASTVNAAIYLNEGKSVSFWVEIICILPVFDVGKPLVKNIIKQGK